MVLNKNGATLTMVVFAMVFFVALGLTAVNIFSTSSYETADFIQSTQALGLAQAGVNWYLERLETSTDWVTSATNQTGIALWPGTFDVTTSKVVATKADISVTSNIATRNANFIHRTMTRRFLKLPQAFCFALYKAGGNALTLNSNTLIRGNAYSRAGAVSFATGATLDGGEFYYNAGSVTGAQSELIAAPAPAEAAPVFTNTYYTGLMTTLGALATNNTDVTLNNTTLTLAGNYPCRSLITTGTVLINGSGSIAASRFITLGSTGTCTISPSPGGTISIVAKGSPGGASRDLLIGSGGICIVSGSGNTLDPNVRFYNSSRDVYVQTNGTNVDQSLIMVGASGRYIYVRNRAQISNSTLYSSTVANINISGVNASNYPICGSAIFCQGPTLIIQTYARINGIVYYGYGTAGSSGFTLNNNVTLRGSVVNVRNFGNANTIGSSSITYDVTQFPDPPPRGFEGVVMEKPFSWDGS